MQPRAVALLVAVLSSCVPARAADAPAPDWKYATPFCGVIAAVGPVGSEGRYGLALFAEKGTTLAAHVTLVSNTDAYDVSVPDANLSGPIADREFDPVVVALPSSDSIKYYFVDSFALDGGASVTCPSYVFPIGDGFSGSPGDAAVITAKHLQPLGKLASGQMYRPVDSGRYAGALIGHYGNQRLSARYRVFVDSDGHAASAKLLDSSGVTGVDTTGLGSVEGQQYVPAQFLCTPVVGEIVIQLDYIP